MKNLLEYLLNHIVAHPEDVRVEESENERGFLYTIHVHPEDMGKIIGRNGNVIQAIRTLAKTRAVKEHIRAQVVIAEVEGSEQAEAGRDESIAAESSESEEVGEISAEDITGEATE